MIKIKKLLTSLTSLGVVASAASLVVSCGLSDEQLMDREIDTTVYKTVFNNSITNWNMAATMQSNDFKILANTQDTLLTYDNDRNLKPQIVDVPTPSGNTVTLHVNEKAEWFDISTGEPVRPIKASDIANTGRYTLNKHNGSELVKDWETFVRGATAFKNSEHQEDSKFIVTKSEDVTNETGMLVDDSKNEITFYLNKGAEYFPSALTTGTFAPTPAEALGLGIRYGREDYKNVLISGPYYVASKDDMGMVFKKNSNYALPESGKGTIKTIEYIHSNTTDDITKRRYWETGDVTEAMISPSDQYATDRYKNFKGKEYLKNNLVGQKYIYFNFAKKDDSGNPDKESNNALSFNSVRTWISYQLNRKLLVQYFAGSSKDEIVKNYYANTLNPTNFVDDTYSKTLSDAIGRDVKDDDAYYQNDKLINDDLVQDEQGKNPEEKLLSKVKKDLQGKTVNLDFLTSGVNSKTFNPYIQWMIDDFNQIKNNPVHITQATTGSDGVYQSKQRNSNFSMFITGQTPTYNDPMSFLINFTAGGTMAHYNGTESLFKVDGDKVSLDDSARKNYGISDDAAKDLESAYVTFTDEVTAADNQTKDQGRYESFAKAEADGLYKYKLNIPMYIPNGEGADYLTYVDPDRPNVGYGYEDYKLNDLVLHKTVRELSKQFKTDENNKSAIVKED